MLFVFTFLLVASLEAVFVHKDTKDIAECTKSLEDHKNCDHISKKNNKR